MLNVLVSLFQAIVSGLDLLISHSNYVEGSYSLNITHGEVIHIGVNLNLTVSEGADLSSSPFISSDDIKVGGSISMLIV